VPSPTGHSDAPVGGGGGRGPELNSVTKTSRSNGRRVGSPARMTWPKNGGKRPLAKKRSLEHGFARGGWLREVGGT